VILVVGLVVRMVAVIIEKSLQLMMLGLLNKIAGIILYVLLYTILLSVVLFYALQMHLLKPESVAASKFYPFIQPFGPKAINAFGIVIPFFKDMFEELKTFFEKVATKSSVA
jgi:membrane protein required for colicin V production